MFPNKMRISEKATKELMRVQANTGLTVNVTARIAFLQSIERGDQFSVDQSVTADGRELDKSSWLGDLDMVFSAVLFDKYRDEFCFNEIWAFHVERGLTSFTIS